jgi:hypothetical protein
MTGIELKNVATYWDDGKFFICDHTFKGGETAELKSCRFTGGACFASFDNLDTKDQALWICMEIINILLDDKNINKEMIVNEITKVPELGSFWKQMFDSHWSSSFKGFETINNLQKDEIL